VREGLAMAPGANDRKDVATTPGMRADVCPICGGPNACGGAAGQHHCWCSTMKISPKTLAAVPAGARERICICPTCAGARPQT